MRLFIAAELNSDMKDELTYISSLIKASSARCSITKPQNLHLTLAFIGETDEKDAIISALQNVSFREFSLTLTGTGHFARGSEKLIYAAMKNDEHLIRLQKDITSALAFAGIPADKRKFTPHITLARRVTGISADDIKNIRCQKVSSPVTEFILFSSDISGSAPVYTPLAVFPCRQD